MVYAIRYESAKTLCDIMMRRTGTGTLGNPGDEITEKIASLAAEMLGWDKNRKDREIASLMKVYQYY